METGRSFSNLPVARVVGCEGMSKLVPLVTIIVATRRLTEQIAHTIDERLETLGDRRIFRRFAPSSAHAQQFHSSTDLTQDVYGMRTHSPED